MHFYFDSFRGDHIPNKAQKFIGELNVFSKPKDNEVLHQILYFKKLSEFSLIFSANNFFKKWRGFI